MAKVSRVERETTVLACQGHLWPYRALRGVCRYIRIEPIGANAAIADLLFELDCEVRYRRPIRSRH
jgi:hypothetical protein